MASGSINKNETVKENGESKKDNTDQVPDWVLAKRGIQLLINNKAKEAEELFCSHPDSLVMFSGYSFATFMVVILLLQFFKLSFV